MPIRRLSSAPFDTLVSAKEANRPNPGVYSQIAVILLGLARTEIGLERTFCQLLPSALYRCIRLHSADCRRAKIIAWSRSNG